MNIKIRLTVMSFLQFFIWGAWLFTLGNYWFGTMKWNGTEFGAVFSTLGISSILMPALIGIIADRFLNAEKLFSLLHLISGVAILFLPQVKQANTFYYVIFLAMLFYMPSIALFNSINYTILKKYNYEVVKTFPPIRVWGTIGFISAMWATNLTGNKASANMFYISGISSVLLALYSLTLPSCPPQNTHPKNTSILEQFGLNAFGLFKNYKMAVFFLFSLLLGASLQLTNMYGDVYLSEFAKKPEYINSIVVKYSTLILSISQISETFFILSIPFFLHRFGIKKVMLLSMGAWVIRFGLFAFGNPSEGLWMIIVSCIVYGMAFDFFNISGSLFVESAAEPKMRSSAQGLFMLMANGLGAFLGGIISGKAIDLFFTHNGNRDWFHIWLSFSGYALIIAIAFAILFKHKHTATDSI